MILPCINVGWIVRRYLNVPKLPEHAAPPTRSTGGVGSS